MSGPRKSPRRPADRTGAKRAQALRERSADVLGPVHLDAEHANALATILHSTGETRAGLVRRLVREESARLEP